MSKEIFEKNLKAMEKWYPEFPDAIREEKYEKDELEIEVTLSNDGEKIFVVKKEDRILYLNGKRNAREPLKMWMNRLKDLEEIHKYASVILLGVGSGLYIKRLIQETDKTVNVMVYEPSMTIFLRMLEEVDLSKEIENRPIAFVVEGLNEGELDPVTGKLISVETLEFLKEEIHPNYQELFPEKIVDVLKKMQKRIDAMFVNLFTETLFATHIAKNEMQNMRYLCDGYNTKKLSDVIPHDGPAILVSAGPSLNENVKDLKKAKNRAFILAVDTAVKPLVNAGIIPDAFITIDAKKPLDLVEVDVIKDTPVVAPVTANHDILKKQRGKKIFYSDSYMLSQSAYLSIGKVLPDVSSGGSVACSGFSLLYKMGFDTVILVGQDLAFTNNRSHADGTFEEIMPERDTKNMVKVKGNYVDEIPTLSNLKLYLDWFKMYIEGAKERREKFRVINATAGGAYIEGTELMSLSEAIDKNCKKEETNFTKCIENMETEFTEDEREKLVKFLHSIPSELDMIRKESKNLYRAYHKILRIYKSGNVSRQDCERQLKKIKKAKKKSENSMAYQLISISMPAAEYLVRSESLYELDDSEEEGVAIAKQGMRYAKMVEECAGILKEFADETLLPVT